MINIVCKEGMGHGPLPESIPHTGSVRSMNTQTS